MATARKTPVGAAAAVLLLLIVAGALSSASASALTLHLKPGCIQPKSASCGVCYNIGPVFKGYYFNYYGGQAAMFYYGFNWQGRYDLIRWNIRCCKTPCRYKSVFIPCYP